MTFPILRKSTESDLIVLFVNELEGFVIESTEYKVGSFQSGWVEPSDTQWWEDYNEEIPTGKLEIYCDD